MTVIADKLDLTRSKLTSAKVLNITAEIWFLVAVIGHLLFAYYIMVVYGASAAHMDASKANETLPTGIMEGDLVGNIFLIAHLFLAFVIMVGGPLQLIPQLRKKFLIFHKWNGRVYVVTAFVISIAGLYLTYFRDSPIAGVLNTIGITLNAVLIIGFAILTIYTARRHDVVNHRKWALRTFLMVAGVWFMRLGYGLWIFLHNGQPPGITSDLQGWFDITLGFANSLVPLACLELYLYARDRGGAPMKWAVSGLMIILIVGTGIGIFMAAQIFWLPRFPGN